LTGVEIGVRDWGSVLYVFLSFRVLGQWVGVCLYTLGFCLVCVSIFSGVRAVGRCVLIYARAHAQTTLVIDVNPVVGWTLGKQEESRSTKAQYTCRPYRCTKYTCLYICWAAGFDDLG